MLESEERQNSCSNQKKSKYKNILECMRFFKLSSKENSDELRYRARARVSFAVRTIKIIIELAVFISDYWSIIIIKLRQDESFVHVMSRRDPIRDGEETCQILRSNDQP